MTTMHNDNVQQWQVMTNNNEWRQQWLQNAAKNYYYKAQKIILALLDMSHKGMAVNGYLLKTKADQQMAELKRKYSTI